MNNIPKCLLHDLMINVLALFINSNVVVFFTTVDLTLGVIYFFSALLIILISYYRIDLSLSNVCWYYNTSTLGVILLSTII